MRHAVLLATILALVTAACGSGGAAAEGNMKDLVPSAKYPTHFAGVPPEGTHPSAPTTGKLLLSFSVQPNSKSSSYLYMTWNVYADGRVIWQKWNSRDDAIVIPAGARRIDTSYVQQRLTPRGVQLLRARILSTGLFEHNLRLGIARHHPVIFGRVRRGDHMVTLGPGEVNDHEPITKATPDLAHGFAQLQAMLTDTAAWSLPATAWADREVRAFLPAQYLFAYDRGTPDLTKLPSPLLPYKKLFSHGPSTCQILTTGYLRTILQAFLEAGIAPLTNRADEIAFKLEGPHGGPSGPHFSPVLPSDSPC
jgi:hypothetical protein